MAALTGMVAAIALTPSIYANSLELVSGTSTVYGTALGPAETIYVGAVGGWNITVTTGLIAGADSIDVNSTDLSSTGPAAPLYIYWSVPGTFPTGGSVTSEIGGTSSGPGVSFSTYYGATPITSSPTYGAGAFSGTQTGITGAGTYTYLEEIIIGGTATGANVSFDASLAVTPNPVPDGGTTLMLLGGAMTGLVAIRSKFGKK